MFLAGSALLYNRLREQMEAAKAVTTTPDALQPAAPMPPLAQPSPAPPPLPGAYPAPSSASFYPTASPSVPNYGTAANVQAAAISPDPTALTGDAMSPEVQSQNRAQMLKVVGAALLIWLILSKTGR